MSLLASALSESMTNSSADLFVLERGADTWRRCPWPEVHARAQAVALRILDDGRDGDVGLVGEPTVDFVAAVIGSLLAGVGISILAGPVRGADPQRWAETTLRRFAGIGVDTVFSHGVELDLLGDRESPLPVLDVAAAARADAAATITPRDAKRAVLQGTAGSTGTPRTAVVSPEAALANIRGLIERLGIDASTDIGCSWLPLYHDMGLALLFSGAVSGAPFWLAGATAFAASPFRWLRWLSESEATVTAGPNFAYNIIGQYATRVADADLGNVRVAINGGEPVDCEGFPCFAEAMSRFGFNPKAAAPAYGLAESTCAVTMPAAGTGLRVDEVDSRGGIRRHAILGPAVPGMEIRVVPADDHLDSGREVGEIEIRGTSMMASYHGEPELDRESWFPTGDLGYFADGGLVVCGRVKEIISVAGRNIFPTEVEQVAAQVPGVRAGAVVAVGIGADAGQPGILVLMAPGSLPRTSSGKLRRLEAKRSLEDRSWSD